MTNWKIRPLFDVVSDTYAKLFNHEHSAADEVIVLFRGRIIFKQYIPYKPKCFGIKIYILRDMTGYTYDMSVNLGRDDKMQHR
jgi:hypothetical protein